jgi:hypothetical protein
VRYNKRYSALFQKIKKLFNNQEIKDLLKHFPTTISSYLVANISDLTNKLIDNKNIDTHILSDDEFKRKEVTTHINDDVQVEVVNVEDDTGPFPKIEQE